jgi:tetratricopeptide (TPR) repeat protein
MTRDRRVILRWSFLLLGWLLVLAPQTLVDVVLNGQAWADRLFPENDLHQKGFIALLHVFVLCSGLLSLTTAWGLRRNLRWSRWCGIFTCIVLLAGFPWLTALGIVGLLVLIAKPPKLGDTRAVAKDYWTAKQQSVLQPILSGALFLAAIVFMGWLSVIARRSGMPTLRSQSGSWFWFVASLLMQTALHEFGHASVAWALGSRIKAISVGPFLFSHDRYGYHFHFNWRRLLDSGGYVGSIPLSEKNVRMKQIAVVAAGPIASFLTGLVALAGFFCLASIRWQGNWRWVAFNAAIGLYYTVANLVPVGYCDGTMLLNLVLWTRHARELLNRVAFERLREDAQTANDQADFEKQAALHEEALRQARAGSDRLMMAASYQGLGHALLAQDEWHKAEEAFRACLEFQTEVAALPPLAGNVWSGLHTACVKRHRSAEAEQAYASAVAVLETRKKDRAHLPVTLAILAQVHDHGGKIPEALEESKASQKLLPAKGDWNLMRAKLLIRQARCELRLGMVEEGLATAQRASELLRSNRISAARRNAAAEELGALAGGLWESGRASEAEEAMLRGIELLEAGGAATTAARYRIKLASVRRHTGRPHEAAKVLPAERNLSDALRRSLLAERARLHLESGRPADALADSRELLALWQVEGGDAAAEIAVAKGLLAQACLDAGGYEQARVLARKAGEVLAACHHPEAASCLLTQALARWRTGWEIPACIGEVRQIVQSDGFATEAERTRFLETEARRAVRHGRFAEAEALRGRAPAVPLCTPSAVPASFVEVLA